MAPQFRRGVRHEITLPNSLRRDETNRLNKKKIRKIFTRVKFFSVKSHTMVLILVSFESFNDFKEVAATAWITAVAKSEKFLRGSIIYAECYWVG